MTGAIEELELIRAEAARRKLATFARWAWPYAGTTQPIVDGWYVDAICDHLQAAALGDIKRLVINCPPRIGKSTFGAVCLPAWCWVRDPTRHMLFASYGHDLATRDSMNMRDLVASEWYQERFVRGAWALRDDHNRRDDFRNTLGGRRVALGLDGRGTGEGGTLVVVDDPIKATDAYSEAKREDAIRWWTQTMPTRVNDPNKSAFVIVMQRLHEKDLSGHSLAYEGGYDHLLIPMEYDPKRSKVTSLGWKDPRKEPGELLCPSRFSRAVLDDMKVALGSYGYAGQMQQDPAPAEGGMFKRKDWRFWKPDGVAAEGVPRPEGCWTGPAIPLPRLEEEIISLDCAFKANPASDRVAFVVIGRAGARRFVLDVVAKRIDAVETARELLRLAAKWPRAVRKLIEAKANGDAVVSMLKGKLSGMIEIEPEGGKESRAVAIQPEQEAGDMYLPEGAPWLDDYIGEFSKFPNGANDDLVDATSQALGYWRVNASDMSLWRILK